MRHNLRGSIVQLLLAALIALSLPACSDGTPEKSVVSIFIAAQPSKLLYRIGEDLDTGGMIVTALYSDASTAEITGYDMDGFDSETDGIKIIIVSYNGKMAGFGVMVIELAVYEIQVANEPFAAKCAVGEDLDLTGLVIGVGYTDETIVLLEPFAGPGGQMLTVAYGGKTAEIPVREIDVSDFDTGNLPEWPAIPGFDSASLGEQAVTLGYGGKDTKYTVTVIEVTEIDIAAFPDKLRYSTGEALDLAGLEVTVLYSDDTREIAPVSAEHVSGFDSETPGVKLLTISYGGSEVRFTVTVVGLNSLTLKRRPYKTTYSIGEALDTTGLIVEASYTDGIEKNVTEEVTFTGFNTGGTGSRIVYAGYGGRTAPFTIVVVSEVVVERSTLQDKLAWMYSDAASGGIYLLNITADESLPPQELDYNGKNNITVILRGTGGERTISLVGDGSFFTVGSGIRLVLDSGVTLQGGGVTVNTGGTFVMNGGSLGGNAVSGAGTIVAVAKIEIANQPIQRVYPIYASADSLDVEGLEVTATYFDGSTKTMPVTGGHVTGFNPNMPGEQTLTVTIDDKTATFSVTIVTAIATVYFYPDGGSWNGDFAVKSAEAIPELNCTVLRPDDPSRDHFVFGGWYTADNAEWDFTAVVAGDTALTAKWLTVNDADFGSGAAAPSVIYVTNAGQWADALGAIAVGGSYRNYVINVAQNIDSLEGTTASSFGAAAGIKVAIRGYNGSRTVSVNTDGRALTVGAGQTVILRDLTLGGRGIDNVNNNSLVRVESSGTLEMRGSAGIIENYFMAPANGRSYGGGVYVNGGTFIMRDSSRVSGNAAIMHMNNNLAYYGGGVYVTAGGIFEMYGGTVGGDSEDLANMAATYSGAGSAYGGGVYVNAGSTFEMNGGIISGNGAGAYSDQDLPRGWGGGVYNMGTFRITEGTIAGNIARGGGGQLFGNDAQCGYFRGGIWNTIGGQSATDDIIVVRNGAPIPSDLVDELLQR